MEPTNRRDFLKHASVAAAVAGAAVAAPVTIADAAAALADDKKKEPAVPADAKVDRHVVAHLRDVQTGEVDIYAGDTATTVKDKRLAALLYKASR